LSACRSTRTAPKSSSAFTRARMRQRRCLQHPRIACQ
jgi:hypothetical protein